LQSKATITLAASLPGCFWRRVGEEKPTSAAWTKTKEQGARLVAAKAAKETALEERRQKSRETKFKYSHNARNRSLCPSCANVSKKYQQKSNRVVSEFFVGDDTKEAMAAAALSFNAARAAVFSSRRLANLKSSSSNGGGGCIGGASSLDTR
jgi:hypothetical protein